jgi:hypothetical protein
MLAENKEKEMRNIGIVFVAIAISVIFSVPSEAAEKRLALVIGNAAYQNAPLKNTINDANDMEKMLKQSRLRCYRKSQCKPAEYGRSHSGVRKKIIQNRCRAVLFFRSWRSIQRGELSPSDK